MAAKADPPKPAPALAGIGGTTYGGTAPAPTTASAPAPAAAPAPAPAPPPPAASSGAFASLTGTGDISSGFDDANIYGGLLGNSISAVTPLDPKIKVANLHKDIIRRYVNRNLTQLETCYTDQLAANKRLEGMLTVTFTIGGDGKVTNAKASGTTKPLRQCVEKSLTAIVFPKPKNGKPTQVSYPFRLTPMQGFGFGTSGFGPGGGGTGWGTIGTGRYGTIGTGSGGLGASRKSLPNTSIGNASVSNDSLDKAIIRRYVKRNIAKITYCYEKELLSDAALTGTLTAKFTIDGEGNVSGATASGLNANVQDCVVKTISGIQFPKPKDGKSLDVTYPMTMTPASP